jgi:hypothetical protein
VVALFMLSTDDDRGAIAYGVVLLIEPSSACVSNVPPIVPSVRFTNVTEVVHPPPIATSGITALALEGD